MKALKLTIATALLALTGFAQTTDAAPARKGIARNAKKLVLKTDLRCSVEGFYDAQGTKPLANGAHPVNLDEMYVRVTVHNAGRMDAKGFTNSVKVNMDGAWVHDDGETFDLPAGFSMSFPMVKVDTHHSSSVIAVGRVDTDRNVSETSERNNSCRYSVKSNKLH